MLYDAMRTSPAEQLSRLVAHIKKYHYPNLPDAQIAETLSRGEGRPRQRQSVMAEPLGERADVARQRMRLGFSLTGAFQFGGEAAVALT